MESHAQQKLFRYIDEHIAIQWQQWQQIYASLQRTPEISFIDLLPAQLFPHLTQSHIDLVSLGVPQTSMHATYAGASSRTLLFYIPMHHCRHLDPLLWSLAALEAYHATMGQGPATLKWLLDFGEGERLPELVATNPALLQANDCLWYYEEQGSGVSPLFALGTKGQLRVELCINTATTAPPTAHAGVLPNALWRLVWAMNSLKNAQEDIVIAGFYDDVRTPEDDQVATLHRLPDTAQSFAQRWGYEQALLGLHGWHFHYANTLIPTCTLSSITGSAIDQAPGRTASIPVQARAQLEFQLVPAQDPHDIFEKLCQHLRAEGFADIAIRCLSASAPISLEETHPFVQAIVQGSNSVYKRRPSILPLSAGSYQFAPLQMDLGIPVVLDLMSMSADEVQSDGMYYTAQQTKQVAMIMERLTQLL